MPMEEGTLGLLAGIFYLIVFGLFVFVLALLFSKKYRKLKIPYTLLIWHLTFLALAGNLLLDAFSFDSHHPMASEEITLRLAFAGGLWVLSMFFFALSILKFSIHSTIISPHETTSIIDNEK